MFTFACSSSKEVSYSSNSLQLWDLLSYHPNSEDDLVGDYLLSGGWSGEHLKLEADGSYFLKRYSHLQVPGDVIDGYKGRHQIRADTLFLEFESFKILPNETKEISQVDSIIYGNMFSIHFSPKTDTLNYDEKVKRALEFQETFKTDERFSRYHEMNYYHIKRAGDTIFLVKSGFKDFFLDQLEKQEGLFIMNTKLDQMLVSFHLTKLKN